MGGVKNMAEDPTVYGDPYEPMFGTLRGDVYVMTAFLPST